MRKLVVGEWVSVDGLAADENGTTSFFEDKKWSKGSDEDMVEQMKDFDTILLGANTYQMFLSYWPMTTTDTEIIADWLNETPKIIFSKTIQQVEWGKWKQPELVSGNAVEAVRKLKEQDGKNIILWGSLSLFRSLMHAGLVDEVHLRTVPIILGKGSSLFKELDTTELQLKKVKEYESGLVLNVFATKR